MGAEVRLTRAENGEFIIDLGSAALPQIRFNPLELDEATRANEHMGARLLMAAALTCFVNTMANDLKARNVSRVAPIEAHAEITKEKDDHLRTRYTHIELNVESEVAEADRAAFESVRGVLLRGSLLTYSLENGLELDYNIEAK
ncbi:osmotically inducible protein OsmC [Desulfovibrio aminophilus]|uniref:osmotically inducible protein OsmC n=1 Tax=Desulfovibrio aminophilus TaxID=81425 RepID=UPI003394D826